MSYSLYQWYQIDRAVKEARTYIDDTPLEKLRLKRYCAECKQPFYLGDIYEWTRFRRCEICNKERIRLRTYFYEYINKERKKAIRKVYLKKNAAVISVKRRALYIKHRWRNMQYAKRWRLNNIERVREKKRQWRERNKEHIKAYMKEYRQKNKHRIAAVTKRYRERKKHDTRKVTIS